MMHKLSLCRHHLSKKCSQENGTLQIYHQSEHTHINRQFTHIPYVHTHTHTHTHTHNLLSILSCSTDTKLIFRFFLEGQKMIIFLGKKRNKSLHFSPTLPMILSLSHTHTLTHTLSHTHTLLYMPLFLKHT